MEPPTHTKLHDRRWNDQEPVDALHGDQEPGLKHDDHRNEAKDRRSNAVAQQRALLALACGKARRLHRLACRFALPFVGTPRKVECSSRHFIARVRNHARKISSTCQLWEITNRCALGGEVDAHLTDAIRLAQEAIDAIHARGAGHPHDRKGDLRRLDRQFTRRCGRVLHTPGEYTATRRVRLPP